MQLEPFAKTLIGVGVLIVIVGIIMLIGGKLGIGKLPGDIYIEKGHFSFYFPIATSIMISVVLSIIFSFLKK